MYLAVKKALLNNECKLPEGYPCSCLEMEDGARCPDDREAMTVVELENLKKQMKPQYEVWEEKIYKPFKEKNQKDFYKNEDIQLKLNALNRKEFRTGLDEADLLEKKEVEQELEISQEALDSLKI